MTEQQPRVTGINLNRAAKAVIRRALREDLRARGDITTRAIIPTNAAGRAVIIAKSPGVIAGLEIAKGVFRELDRHSVIDFSAQDGDWVAKGAVLAKLKGVLWAILVGERTALNILMRCSGIATLTRRFVDAVAGTGARITETRKTAPGLRYLDKASVTVGGGVNHRGGLHDAFLIKENHVTAAGGIIPAIEACRRFAAAHGRFRIMVEARNLNEFRTAQSAAPDRILLDNMAPDQIAECVRERIGGIELEATGGINLDNARLYAAAGVDYLSIGALTHSVQALDLSLLVEEA